MRFAIENENWDPSTTMDELISEATNQRVTKIDNNFISQFVKKVRFKSIPLTKAFSSCKTLKMLSPMLGQ